MRTDPEQHRRSPEPAAALTAPLLSPGRTARLPAGLPRPAGPPRSSSPRRNRVMDGARSPGSLPAPGADGRGAGIALTCGGGGDNPGGAAGGDGRWRWSQGGGRRARTGELLRAHVTCGSAARPLCRDTLGPPCPCPSLPPALRARPRSPTHSDVPARAGSRGSRPMAAGRRRPISARPARPAPQRRRDQPQGPDVPGSATAPPPRAGLGRARPLRSALPSSLRDTLSAALSPAGGSLPPCRHRALKQRPPCRTRSPSLEPPPPRRCGRCRAPAAAVPVPGAVPCASP